MGIGSEFARSVVMEQYINKDPFWNSVQHNENFEELNKVRTPRESEIRKFQVEKIKDFQQTALSNKFAGMNNFAQGNFQELISKFESDETKEIDKAITNLVTRFNSVKYYTKGKDADSTRSEKEWHNIQIRLQNMIGALKNVINKVGASTPVLESELTKLQYLFIQAGMGNNGDIEAVRQFINKAHLEKGDLLEEIGVAWIRSLNVPTIDSIKLGSVYEDTISKKTGKAEAYLLQDVLAYDITDVRLDSITVEYRVAGKPEDGYQTCTLRELFKIIEKANGSSKTVHINDNTLDAIMALNSLAIQAKSGKDQLPWNVNARTSVSICDFSNETLGLALGINRTFQLLKQLNNLDNGTQPWLIKDTSEDYQALANYGLATVMNKVLHLSEKDNQYLLTAYGWKTYPERVEELFKKLGKIATIQDTVNLSGNLGPYTVNIS